MEAAECTGPAERPHTIPAGEPPPPTGQLDAALDHLTRLCGRLETAEQRFKQLTDECEGVLQGLVAVDRHHSSAVASLNERLGEWCNLEGKLLQESARRIEQFERGVGHEWMVIRQMHEEPIAELKDQAAQLRLTCLEAARLARFRLDSAEQAYSAYAADLERRMSDWNQELLKAARRSPEPWPLEGVAQLHQELRAGSQPSLPPTDPRRDGSITPFAARGERAAPASKAADVTPRRGLARSAIARRVIVVFAAAVLVTLGVYAWRTGTSAETRRRAAVPPVAAAASSAPARQEPTHAAADERASVTQREADRVGTIVEILAAPDLRRYALAGVAASASGQPYGQVLWSRSRGLAASASRLAPLPDGKVYQLWIVPDGPAMPAGVLTPDAAGRASFVVAGPLKLPLPATIRVTVEDRGRTASPRGPVYLVRVPTS